MSQKTKKAQPRASKGKTTRTADRFQLWWVLAAVAVLALGGFWLFQQLNTPTAATSSALPLEISVTEAYEKYEAGVFVLDVRTPEEWTEYHAPNTTLIPLDQLAARVDEIPKDQEIVVICRSGNRSQEGRDILLSAGFEQVTSVAGGLNEWRSTGYPVVSGP
ncbi:MAG: rhodanese-like domain-containing protein [Anaerolineales bacterium]|nr:rhodanese-like domain-containing protein [Anaerolineales bacterium]